jgi:hypothetical protein
MSQKEFQRLKVIENAAGGPLSLGEAARLLQLGEQQVQRQQAAVPAGAAATSGGTGPIPWPG